MNGNCKYCGNSFQNFELSAETCDTPSWVEINVYDNNAHFDNGTYLEFITSGYNSYEKNSMKIYYCPWCGKQLKAKKNN